MKTVIASMKALPLIGFKADCLVHNSCTTAVEASLTGLPCFALPTSWNNIYDAQLPNSVSERFDDG